jgi:hypothetical protein
MDPDYSAFSLMPPLNVVHAQLIDPTGALVTRPRGITVTYLGGADSAGSINSTSSGKTNYWEFAPLLHGASSVANTGLFGADMPGAGNVPRPMV